ncbi:DUF2249 domain-containing protein [Pseudonocardia parietis]|uniref:Uncharacterized protein (DUF2249 family)/quercetin dioxygenase-like cupin family protein n=1 Tax=Pseudonocardia parietis TaxID=570936 RepID=A0ABS4W012_9PSEU|nr:DUF2249 domain-containing protein [Pseudonocardia parietis]MBP2369545.1 uncharacterized protein (DUF2249 family)/quercetin dioxygenase-like cupin family protein [Pseudonocardia parietis]
MSTPASPDSTDVEDELDVRPLRKPDKHPTIFTTFGALPVGGSFVLVNDHDPRHLRNEFEADLPGGYGWEYLNREPRDWRIRITKLASTPLPRVLARTDVLGDDTDAPDATGALWKLDVSERDLDSNVIALPPGKGIAAHTGPDLDVLVHVLAGSGQLTTELGDLELVAGALLWLPRGSRRAFTAGPDGLRYLTVHRRRQALVLEAPESRPRG